ncbi:MAG: glycoside hydrolase family 43 protein [Muribaculaceae bacterium]|nr:glycoside hydrolase family 43 protein [Muribaculaceae bacterium]
MKKHLCVGIALSSIALAAAAGEIRPGEIWPDNNGQHINAHGGGVLAHDGTYYWFGEHKSDNTSSALVGVTCYSSKDLSSWTDRGVALKVVDEQGHDLERGCVLERPKVVYNPLTKKFVMWFHLELKGKGYSAARYGVATSDRPEGPYTYLRSGRVLPGIYPSNMSYEERNQAAALPRLQNDAWEKAWSPEWRADVAAGMFNARDINVGQMARDQTVYVDEDGKAYHVFSSEENLTLIIAELSDDYTSHTGRYIRVAPGDQNEAPAILKKDGTYWMITSGCTGWDPNEARMYSAPSMWGPWERHPNPCEGPNAELTFGGQSTYILNVPGTDKFIFMADVWRPKHPSDARYVWLPISWKDGKPSIQWAESWDTENF